MGSYKDLTGQTFGDLTVRERSGRSKWGTILWSCFCLCGKIVNKTSDKLNSNSHCGCKTSENVSRSRIKDISGLQFNNLFVICRIEGNISKYLVRCDVCNKEKIMRVGSIKISNSCGCLKNIRPKTTTYLKERQCWGAMKNRCSNTSNQAYKNYGGRGIRVCDRWLESFENFYEDMGKAPTKDHSIERLNFNLDYCPENCIWLELKYQPRNKRSTVLNVEIVKQIRVLFREGKSNRDIANLLVINIGTIYHVTSGRSWKEV